MSQETLKISSVIKKPSDERSKEELDEILPYLVKRSELLSNLQKGTIIRHMYSKNQAYVF